MKALNIATCHLIESGHGSIYEPVREIDNRKIYINGDFSVVKLCEKDYAVLWKNVIIGEFLGVNSELCDRLATKNEPDPRIAGMQKYNYKEAIKDIEEAPIFAKKYNFTIC